MSDSRPIPATPRRWTRLLFLVLVFAALAAVMFAWFHTPVVEVASDTTGESTTIRCANAGPSRWNPPAVSRGQELADGTGPAMQFLNQQIIKNDIESLRVDLACGQARDAHTNTLIVTTFAAGAVLFFGYSALWVRPTRPRETANAA